MRKFFLFVVVIFGCVFNINAQLYYFVESGKEVTSSTTIMMVYVRGSKMYSASKTASEISSKLHSNSSYWEDWMRKKLRKDDEPYEYDSSLSTSSYNVYKSPWRGQGQIVMTGYGSPYGTYGPSFGMTKGSRFGDYYRGISSDGSTCITWRQSKDSDEVKGKTYWERVNPDILNQDPHDFLR